MAGAAIAEATKPVVTFEDAPGPSGYDEMFNDSDSAPAPKAPIVPVAPVVDPAQSARLDALENQNRVLTQQAAERDAQLSQQHLDGLLSQYEDAVATGRVADAQRLRNEVTTFKQAIKAPAAITPTNAPAPLFTAPAGHWSHNTKSVVTDWIKSQDWWGVDVNRMAAVDDVSKRMLPEKFATPQAYFEKLLETADGRVSGVTTPAPAPQSDVPVPRVQGGGPRGSSGGSGDGYTEITAVRQLRGQERQAAEDAMRYGNLDEKTYLASYNDVQRRQTKKGR